MIIDRKTVDLLRAEINAAIQAVADKHGLSLKASKAAYSNGTHGSVTVEIATLGQDGIVQDRAATDFKAMATFYGFQADDFGKTFTTPQGKTFTIVGLRANARKTPIIGRSPEGKDYIFPESVAKYVNR